MADMLCGKLVSGREPTVVTKVLLLYAALVIGCCVVQMSTELMPTQLGE